MRFAISVPMLLGALALGSYLSAAPASIPQDVAATILADSADLGERIRDQLSGQTGTNNPGIRGIRADLEDPSQWRYYSRDRGILIAISVKRNLYYADKQAGELAIAEIVERLIQQKNDVSVAGGIRVIFIEPDAVQPYLRSPRIVCPCVTEPAAPAECPCF
jgi:hypothetical protein